MGEVRNRIMRAILGADDPLVTGRAMTPTDVRDPRAATQNFPGTSYNALSKPMVAEWDADTAFRFAYYANVFVYRCVQIISQAVASMPFRAGPDPNKPGDFNPQARLAELLGPPPKGPAPKLAARRLWAWSVAQYLVTGRICWELELAGQGFGNNDIVNIWPLASSRFGAIPSTSGVEWFRAFEYNYGSRTPVPLKPEAVFYAWRPSARDFRQPESVLQAARLDVSVAVMQDRYDYAFLRNDARPASIVVHERFAKAAERDAFREQWNASYGGPDNAGKTAFLEAGDPDEESSMDVRNSLHIEALGLSQRDGEFIARYQQKLTAICVAFGTPISKLGDASDRTFSNAKDENRNWWRDTVHGLALELQDAVNLDLAARLDGGRYVGWFDTSGVPELQPEPFWQPEPLSNLVGVLISEEEGRVLIGMPEQMPDNFAKKAPPAVLGFGAPPPAALPPGEPAPANATPPPEPIGAPKSAPPRALAEVVEIRDAIRDGLTLLPAGVVEVETRQALAERRSMEARQAAMHFDTLEVTWEAEFKRLFDAQRAATLSRLRGRRGAAAARRDATAGLSVSADGIFNVGHWNQVVTDAARTLYRQTAHLAAHRLNGHRVRAVTNALGGEGDLMNVEQPAVVQFIQARANKLAGQVNDTTYGQIQDQLSEGVANGENMDALVERIGMVFDASDTRARTIARTESVSAYNGATATIFDTYGPDVAAGQEWLATGDDRTRADHGDADGQQVAAGESFQVGGESLAYPGDPDGSPENVVNCFPADTIVASAGIEAVYRRWYEGPMVTVRTRSGHVLTGTPNHPALTDRGWIALGSLDVGDDLIHCETGVAGFSTAGITPYVQRAPAQIGQVFDALALMGRLQRMIGRPVDFHGDGREGQVDVVLAASRLQVGEHAAAAEQARQLDLSVPHLVKGPISGRRSEEQGVHRVIGAASGHVGSQGKPLTLVGAGLGHAEVHGGAAITSGHAGSLQPRADGSAGDAVALAERLLALPGDIARDEIVGIDIEPFAGHVFNLQTNSGWYNGNGLIVSNCRCTTLILTPEDMGIQPDITRTVRPITVIPLEQAERAAIRLALRNQEAG